MNAPVIASQKFFGLLELDADGRVLYSRIERDADWHQPAHNITGRNFYSEVAPFLNVEEFHRCLDNFSRSAQAANTIPFTCQYEDGPVQVKVLLARIRERSEDELTKSILVHIRKVQ
jgi:hypothetical protein